MFSDFRDTVSVYIDLIINKDLPLKKNLSSKLLPDAKFISTGQWKQLAYKTASEIVRSNIDYQKKKIYNKYKRLYAKCKELDRHHSFTSKRFKYLNINYLKRIDIKSFHCSINLDERFFDIEETNGEFDEFINIKLPWFKPGTKRRIKINVPIKNHKHSLKFKDWDRKKTIRLREKDGNFFIDIVYEKEEIRNKSNRTIAFDIGYKKLLVDNHGHVYGKELFEIYKKLSKKQRGSKKYKRLLIHKKNEINRILNTLNLGDFGLVILEDLKNVKKGSKGKRSKSFNNKIQYWSYRQVLAKLGMLSETEGFEMILVDPAYTSQTCSVCGVLDKKSRKGEIYQCASCGLIMDADYNAAINIHSRGVYSPSSKMN